MTRKSEAASEMDRLRPRENLKGKQMIHTEGFGRDQDISAADDRDANPFDAEALFPDPLAGLAERAKVDPAAAFTPDALEALAELQASDRGGFEVIRASLKRSGVRVSALDQMLAAASGDEDGRKTQADMLLELAAGAELFHDPDKRAFADLRVGAARETWPIRSSGFRRWLSHAFFQAHGGAANSDALAAAIAVVEAKAYYDAPERPIFMRIGEHDGKLYLDLGDASWRAVEVDTTGWRIVDAAPCRFRRAAGMLPLPEPVRGGSISALRPLLNVGSDADFVLAVAWLLATLRPTGPFPALVVTGEHGAAKTATLTTLRALVDPCSTPMRSIPREERDLFIAANNAHHLMFDNISGLPNWLSDALCRLSTGGGFSTRALYSDSDEVLFEAMKPLALNGIEDVASRPDLADRALFLALPAIPETSRRSDKAVRADIEAARPGILGALLDAVARGLARLPTTRLDRLPRLADFALWAVACGDGALWPEGDFMSAFGQNRQDAIGSVIEGDVVALAILRLLDGVAEWTGTAATLRQSLGELAGETATKARGWPANDRALAGKLRRLAPFLRSPGVGIELTFTRDMAGRYISLKRSVPVGKFASFASCSSWQRKNGGFLPVTEPSGHDANHDANRVHDANHDATHDANDANAAPASVCVMDNPLENNEHDANDANDANFPTRTGRRKDIYRRGVL